MRTSAGLPFVEELRERIQRLEDAAGRQRTVLSFGIRERRTSGRRWPVAALARSTALPPLSPRQDCCSNPRAGAVVRHSAGPLRSGVCASRAAARPRDLCRSEGRKGCACLFRGGFVAWRAWRRCHRGRAAVHDRIPPSSACRRKLRHHTSLASPDRGHRLRPADGVTRWRVSALPQPLCLFPALDAPDGRSN
jgi:hypothetical protein